VNTEYQNKIEELSTINDDMKNLLNSTGIATILIDSDRRIKHYTAVATEIFNLIETDVGRPIEHVTSSLKFDSLDSITRKASESLVPIKQEVQTRDGRWYSMRVHPYRTSGNTIAGVVMSFIDINEYKNGEKRDPDKEKTMKRLR